MVHLHRARLLGVLCILLFGTFLLSVLNAEYQYHFYNKEERCYLTLPNLWFSLSKATVTHGLGRMTMENRARKCTMSQNTSCCRSAKRGWCSPFQLAPSEGGSSGTFQCSWGLGVQKCEDVAEHKQTQDPGRISGFSSSKESFAVGCSCRISSQTLRHGSWKGTSIATIIGMLEQQVL